MLEKKCVKFLREQYPVNSRIRLREGVEGNANLKRGSMGTLRYIEEDGRFKVRWDQGQSGYVTPGSDSFYVLEPERTTLKLYMPLCAEIHKSDYWGGYDEE